MAWAASTTARARMCDGELFDRGGQVQQFVSGKSGILSPQDSFKLGNPHGQRSGLIKDGYLDFSQLFDGRTTFEDDARL